MSLSDNSNVISLTMESRFSSFEVSAISPSLSVEIYISLYDRIKVKITFCTRERNIFCRYELKWASTSNYSKDVVSLEQRFSAKSL